MADESTGIDLGIEGLGLAEHIGRGGFADVYRAEQLSLRRTVAVKVLRSPASTPETNARFQRECHAIGAVSDHPHIIGVHDSGLTSNGRAYLVMEYLPGGSLADRLREHGPLPIRAVVDIAAKIARALGVAHRAGVLHRDVKPANIMISAYGEPALGDFGIARIDGGHQTVTGQVTASIVHAAPEVLEGHSPSPAADIYSLGSTLFELAVGRAAYYNPTDESMWPVMKRILSEPMPSPASVGFSPALGRVFERATARDPLTRYATADDLAADLSALVEDPAALEAPPEVATRMADEPTADRDRTAVMERTAAPAAPVSAPQVPRPALTSVQLPAEARPPAGGRIGPAPIRRSLGDRLAVPLALAIAAAAVAAATVGLLIPALDRGGDGSLDIEPGTRALEVVGAGGGPLQAGVGYALDIPNPPAGASYRLLIDGQPQGEPSTVVPELVAPTGRHRVQVEIVSTGSTELTVPVDVVGVGPPTPGYAANLARIPQSPDAAPLIEAVDALAVDGHTELEVTTTDALAGVAGGAWLVSVPGFADAGEAEEYCRGAGLPIPERCYAAPVMPATP